MYVEVSLTSRNYLRVTCAVYSTNYYGIGRTVLKDILYPQMKGKVFVHAIDPLAKRKYFLEEPVHPFPPIAKDKRGKFLNITALPVGFAMPPRRTFIAFSIYKRTIFSEFLLTLWLGTMEKTKLFRGWGMNVRFYVADNISPRPY